ncbi:uroporphyrinogen-III synthase [Celeribacter halophilus]|uniref:uroporphyrinogen-III synthase n=1 Tax=Celeribacter halophilus TaxID=576117 RepID=UPI001C092882|nr:uroporphyrinogen-III synthase [Celeribacter halophilus]MBU2889643.1 uroporphyrinogen-III synthase [Celeribacter halophilus]MDO6510715.1 uroporphyrinogen-III synthase [Celeribacter halophilus]
MPPTVLITRPKDDAQRLSQELERCVPDLRVLIAPVMQICATSFDLPDMSFDYLLLTSRHAVPAADACLGLPVYCVGDATRAAAQARGHRVCAVYPDAEALVTDLAEHKGKRALHLHGRHTRGNVSDRLSSAGLETKSRVVYEQVPRRWSEAERQNIHAQSHLLLPLYSPRSARLAAENLQGFAGDVSLIGLSQACLDGWSGITPVSGICLERPDGQAMVRAIASHLAR